MEWVERSFLVKGQEGLGKKPRPELIGPVLTGLHDSLQDAVRMGFLHSSRAPGRIPDVLKRAAELRYLGHEGNGDGTLLRFEVSPFGSAAGELFQQQRLWEDGPTQNETAFELFAAVLYDVGSRRADSNRYDPGLLKRIQKYKGTLNRGVQRIELPDTNLTQRGHIDADVVSAAFDLAAATPQPRRVRTTGRLDLMGASQGVLKIHVQPGEIVTALWDGDMELEALVEYFNRDVVIEGTAIFRPSGALLRIDADAIALASSQDELFRAVPTAVVTRDYSRLLRPRPAERPPYVGIVQSIPAEEPDAEFAAAVDDLS